MITILKKPIISEKSMKLVKNGLFTFLVDKNAQKVDVLKSVKLLFGVDPIHIKMANFKGVIKWQRSKRGKTKTQGYKKAIVRLKKDQKIDLFQPQEEKVEVTTAEGEVIAKEKKSMLTGTKVKIEKENI